MFHFLKTNMLTSNQQGFLLLYFSSDHWFYRPNIQLLWPNPSIKFIYKLIWIGGKDILWNTVFKFTPNHGSSAGSTLLLWPRFNIRRDKHTGRSRTLIWWWQPDKRWVLSVMVLIIPDSVHNDSISSDLSIPLSGQITDRYCKKTNTIYPSHGSRTSQNKGSVPIIATSRMMFVIPSLELLYDSSL